jgi:hypothetical protein
MTTADHEKEPAQLVSATTAVDVPALAPQRVDLGTYDALLAEVGT